MLPSIISLDLAEVLRFFTLTFEGVNDPWDLDVSIYERPFGRHECFFSTQH